MRGSIVGVIAAVFGLVAGALVQPAATSPDDAEGAQRNVVLTQELKATIDGTDSPVVMLELTYPPGAGTPKPQHAGSVFVYGIEGAITSQIEGQPLQTYTQGDTCFEPAGALHLVARHASADQPAKVLAVFLAKKGEQQLTTLMK
jgi:quercetin dioxygenase-like cupin family protein